METENADENKQLEGETKEKHDKIHKIELIANMEEHNIFMCYNYRKDNPLSRYMRNISNKQHYFINLAMKICWNGI